MYGTPVVVWKQKRGEKGERRERERERERERKRKRKRRERMIVLDFKRGREVEFEEVERL
jgi:hypothetical protein